MRGFVIAVLVLAACTMIVASPVAAQDASQSESEKPQTGADTAKPQAVEPMKPMAVPASVDSSYILGADDVIIVRVWREPDLSGVMAVRPDGKITLPLINEVKAAGLTPTQLGDEIQQALSKYVNNPQVVVTVQSVRSKRYYMSGEITRPGAYPLASPVTVFEAITLAGGFREFAKKKKVIVIRGKERFRFNWNEVVKGKKLEQNIRLQSGDQVIVP